MRDECIEWQGSRYPHGYGQTGHINGRQYRAHRRAWEIVNGPIPAGLYVLHKCDNPPCFNVAHLFLGTAKDNSDDKIRKGRANDAAKGHCGSDNCNASFSDETVNEIRIAHLFGAKQTDLAALYGVRQGTISNIITGRARVSKC